jgi:hypothetical protein
MLGPEVETAVATAKTRSAKLAVTRAQVIAFRLERLGLRKRSSDLRAAVGEVGLSDFPPGAALAAFAPRVSRPSPAALERAFQDRSLVRLRAMRGAPIVARAEDYDLFVSGVLPRDERSMRAFIGPAAKSADAARLSALEAVEVVTDAATRALSRQPLDRDALHAALRAGMPKGLLPYCRGCDSHHVHPSLLYAAALRGRFVIFPRDDGPYLVARAERWLGSGKASARIAAQAPAQLLRRFLRAYGPSTAGDFAAWAGLGGGQPQAIWAELEAELAPVEVTGNRSVKWILAADRKRLSGRESAAGGVRVLSPGDPLLQLRDRGLLVPDKKLERVIWKNLAPTGVVLLGTEVAGLARAQKKRGSLALSIEPLKTILRKARSEVEAVAARLAEARGLSDLSISWTT